MTCLINQDSPRTNAELRYILVTVLRDDIFYKLVDEILDNLRRSNNAKWKQLILGYLSDRNIRLQHLPVLTKQNKNI